MALYAFVDAISDSPTIIQHLDDEEPLITVAGVQMPEANRRVSSSGSSARNGDHIAQMSYGDAGLVIPLKFAGKATAEQQSETIQRLTRIVDRESWLMWHPDGVIEPVFYRVKYGTLSVDTEIEDETPLRTMVLNLVVEFASYGLPVTGTATIANDPTAATNPMSLMLDDIQGDVVTSLSLSAQMAGDALLSSVISVSVSAGPSSAVGPLQAGADSVGDGVAGWSSTLSVADTDAIGGAAASLVKTSGSLDSPPVTFEVADIPPGDYRVMLRAKTSAAAVTVSLLTGSYEYDTAVETRPLFDDDEYRWYDFDVHRYPASFPVSTPPTFGGPTFDDSYLSFRADIAGSSGTLRLDRVLLVPAGLDDDAVSTLLLTAPPGNISGTTIIDSLAEVAWVRAFGGSFQPLTIAGGGFPKVMPGSVNRLTLIARLTTPGTVFETEDNQNDDKTLTTVFDYLYYPRYLYTRPATT